MRRAGLYRNYIVFQEKVSSQDEYGSESFLWVDKFPMRAYVQYLSGSKQEINYEPQNPQNIKINVRYRPEINERMRIKVQKTPSLTDTYEILYMEPVALYNELELTVKRIDIGEEMTSPQPAAGAVYGIEYPSLEVVMTEPATDSTVFTGLIETEFPFDLGIMVLNGEHADGYTLSEDRKTVYLSPLLRNFFYKEGVKFKLSVYR